jgi:Na+/H+ antiporter NhaD/arsenite permease-like protein
MFWVAAAILAVTYIGIALTRLPRVNVDRTSAAFTGAVANIIVAEVAAREGVTVSFGEFLKTGILVTAATLAISIGILSLEWRLGFLT